MNDFNEVDGIGEIGDVDKVDEIDEVNEVDEVDEVVNELFKVHEVDEVEMLVQMWGGSEQQCNNMVMMICSWRSQPLQITKLVVTCLWACHMQMVKF